MDEQFWSIIDFNYPDTGEYNAVISRAKRIIRNAEEGVCTICGFFYEGEPCPEHNSRKLQLGGNSES